MIQFKRESNGLARYSGQIEYIDTDSRSRDYFRLYDFPDRMYIGKNTFRIAGNSDLLVTDSQIFIDILDVNGNQIYYEILDTLDTDKTRSVVVYVYPDTPHGVATVYIGGRVQRLANSTIVIPYSNVSTDKNYKHVPNLLWKGSVNIVLDKQNNEEIVFTNDPIVEYTEKIVRYDMVSTGSRNTVYTASIADTISVTSNISPYQISNRNVDYASDSIISNNMISPLPTINNNTGTTNMKVPIPEFTGLTVFKSNNPVFSGSMVGGTLYVRGISLLGDAPPEVVDTSVFTSIPDYSASIVSVLNSTTIEVDRPFTYPVTYVDSIGNVKNIVINRLQSHGNFSASYISIRDNIQTGSAYESFISVTISGAEPSVGVVDSVKVMYKPIGSFGEYIDIGQYEAKSRNILTDSNVYDMTSDGIGERHLGNLKSTTNINSYWSTASSDAASVIISPAYRQSKLIDAIYLSPSGTFSESAYAQFSLRPNYYPKVYKNTEYNLKFDSFSERYTGDWTVPQLDVYISGSSVFTDYVGDTQQIGPIHNHELGTYIGSVVHSNGAIQKNSLSYIVNNTAYITPIFVVRSGKWDIGSIEMLPRHVDGFTSNHVKLNIPLAQFKRRSELIMKLQYYNSNGVKANVESELYGVIFSGSSQLQYTELSNIPTGIVSSSDQVSGGQNKSIQFKYSGSISGSGDFWYDPVNKLLMIGADASTYGEQSYPSQHVIRSTHPGIKAAISIEKSGSSSATSPIMAIIPETYTGSGSLVNIGVGISNPKSPIDAIIRGDHLYSTRESAAGSTSGSGIAFRQQSSSITPSSEVNKFYKLINVSSETSGTAPRLVVLGSVDSLGMTYVHIGTENSQLGGTSNTDSTWVKIGSGSLSSQRFSGSGYELSDIDWNKVINKTSGLVSSSGQTDYNLLINKPRVTNIGSGRIMYNNNDPSHSIAATSIRYSTASSNMGKSTPVEQFSLLNGAQLIMISTSSNSGASHHVLNKQFIYETTGSLPGGILTSIAVPMSFTTYEGAVYTGSINNAGIMYEIGAMFMATTGSNGANGTYVWSSTVQGRASVSQMNSGKPICYVPYIVSGGQGISNSYGYGPPSGSNYDSIYTVSFVTSSGLMYIQNTFQMSTPFGTSWDLHGSIRINQTIYEVDNPLS